MIRILLFSILLIFSGKAYSQDASTDSATAVEELKDALYYQQQGKRATNPQKSLELFKKALSLRSPQQDENWVANVRVEMGSALLKTGKTKEAFSEFLTAEKIYTSTKNFGSQADLHRTMAGFYERNTSWQEAEKYYKSAKSNYEKSEDLGAAASVALHLAELFLIRKELSNAGPHVAYAVKIYEKLDDKTGVALSQVKQAEIYRRRKQFKKAETLILNSALPLFRSSGYLAGRIACFDVLGHVYFDQKRYSEAKWFFIQANTQSRALNDVEGIVLSLVNLSKVKARIGDTKFASRDLREAQTLALKRSNVFLLDQVKSGYEVLNEKADLLADSVQLTSEEIRDSLVVVHTAQVESARTARVRPDPVLPKRKKNEIGYVYTKNDFLFLGMIVIAALSILFSIVLILKRIK